MPRKLHSGADLVNNRAIRVADAVEATDAVTLQQMQAFVRGLAWKQPVRAAATTNVNLSSPGASHDGVALAVNDRLLLPVQTNGADAGIYVWSGASTPLTRASDADTAAELVGASVLVREGTVNADRQFNQTVDTITLGTTVLRWVEFGGATIYTAGAGLNVDGREFSIKLGTGLLVDATGVRVDPSVFARKFSATLPALAAGTGVDVAHNLSTLDVDPTFRLTANGEFVDVDAVVKDANTITVTSGVAIPAGTLRVTVLA